MQGKMLYIDKVHLLIKAIKKLDFDVPICQYIY